MSYDHVWFCPTLYRKDWSELATLKGKESEDIHRQYKSSTFTVELSAGENCAIDEIYVFLKEADAVRFFDGGPLAAGEQCYRDREFRYQGRPIGFDKCSLHINGKMVAWDSPRHWNPKYWNQISNRPKQLS